MVEYIQTKTILSRLKNAPDPYFGISYNMNLYRGCQHQCIYCDSRSDVYGIDDFSKIRIKINATELLAKALQKIIKRGTIGTGSMNDPYMPLESRERITRRALEIIAENHFPVHIITKSDLILRDTDILEVIAKQYAAVSFTITTTDDVLASKIEPGAPVSERRFKALYELARKGIYAGIILSPVLPFITDNKENIKTMVRKAADHGAGYILGWMGMTQRKGQREYYYNRLEELFPALKEKYRRYFGNRYSIYPRNALKLNRVFKEQCYLHHIDTNMNFFHEMGPKQLRLI